MAIAEKTTQKQLSNRTPTSLGCMLFTACSDLVPGRAVFTVLLGLSLSMSAISCQEGPSSWSCWVYHCRCQRSRARKGRLHGPTGSITVDVSRCYIYEDRALTLAVILRHILQKVCKHANCSVYNYFEIQRPCVQPISQRLTLHRWVPSRDKTQSDDVLSLLPYLLQKTRCR